MHGYVVLKEHEAPLCHPVRTLRWWCDHAAKLNSRAAQKQVKQAYHCTYVCLSYGYKLQPSSTHHILKWHKRKHICAMLIYLKLKNARLKKLSPTNTKNNMGGVCIAYIKAYCEVIMQHYKEFSKTLVFLGYHFNTCSVDNTIPPYWSHSTTTFVATKAWLTNTLKGEHHNFMVHSQRRLDTLQLLEQIIWESVLWSEVNSCLDIIQWLVVIPIYRYMWN